MAVDAAGAVAEASGAAAGKKRFEARVSRRHFCLRASPNAFAGRAACR